MRITGLLQLEDILADLSAETKEELLRELAEHVAVRHPDLDRAELLNVLMERERLGSTGIGDGIAIPHGKLKRLEKPLLAFGRSRKGVDFHALDHKPVHLFFLLLAPEAAAGTHLKMLARISRILKDPALRRTLFEAPDSATIYAAIQEQDSHY